MEQPVIIRFRWTDDDLFHAYRYHFRHICRPAFRIGLHFLFAVLLIGGVLMLVSSGPAGKAPLPIALGSLAGGIYWFVFRPFERRWAVRRQFSKRPDRDIELEWQVSADKIRTQSTLGHSEFVWQAFTKMVRTPSGVLLYRLTRFSIGCLVAVLHATLSLRGLLHLHRARSRNTMTWSSKLLQATRDGGFRSAARFTSFGPACLSSGR
jgi:hypothetical protein